jgi:hypothetical protein
MASASFGAARDCGWFAPSRASTSGDSQAPGFSQRRDHANMQPDGDTCISRFDGWLKQHRPTALSEAQMVLLGVAFPGFLATDATRGARTMVTTTAQADIAAAFDPENPARREIVTAKSPRRSPATKPFPRAATT